VRRGSMKRRAAAGLSALLLLALCACTGPADEQTPAPSPSAAPPASGVAGRDDGKVVVGLSMDTLLEERWQKDRDLFKAAVEKLGALIEVQAANGDDARQMQQAEYLISQHVDVLVVVPHNAEVAAGIVDKAHKAGIKVMSYDRLIVDADVDLYVSFDNEKAGELQAKAIVEQAPKGNYVLIEGADTDNNAHMFKKGQMNILKPLVNRGDIRIVFDQFTKEWKPANALDNMRLALAANDNHIDAVVAANDATAGGVIQALSEQQLAGKIPVSGQDAELAGAQRIVEGTQTMTVYKPIEKLAETAADLAVKMAKGEAIYADKTVNNRKIDVPSILLEPIAVDQSNIDATIIADGFHKREDVYKNVK